MLDIGFDIWEAECTIGHAGAELEAFLRRKVLPNAPDVWYLEGKGKIDYEVNLTRYFYKSQPMCSLEKIRADILALEQETEGLLGEIIGIEKGGKTWREQI